MSNKKILALVSDLMFAVKITDAAKRNGLAVEYVKTDEDFLRKVAELPALVIIDLHITSASPVEMIRRVKESSEWKEVKILAYVSHVEAALKQQAQEAGADTVLPRSAFSANLVQLLQGYAGAA